MVLTVKVMGLADVVFKMEELESKLVKLGRKVSDLFWRWSNKK